MDPIKSVKTGIFSTKKVEKTEEELAIEESLTPSCHGKHILNDYFLNVNLSYKGMTAN